MFLIVFYIANDGFFHDVSRMLPRFLRKLIDAVRQRVSGSKRARNRPDVFILMLAACGGIAGVGSHRVPFVVVGSSLRKYAWLHLQTIYVLSEPKNALELVVRKYFSTR